MTKKQLKEWLKTCPDKVYLHNFDDVINYATITFQYTDDEADDEIHTGRQTDN
jgi:hypothetical protein